MSANPEQSVIDAINGLEDDEIGELVKWQIEAGMQRGDHVPEGDDELTEEEVDEIVDILTEIATGIPDFSKAVAQLSMPVMSDPGKWIGGLA